MDFSSSTESSMRVNGDAGHEGGNQAEHGDQ